MSLTPLGDDGCKGCPARCCHGLEEAILRPTTRQDVENLKWELHFVNTQVFIRSKRWYKLSLGRCRYLDENFRCSIYERRPQICRDHSPPDCEFHGEIFDVMFKSPEELQAYIDKENRRKKKKA
ncbi:MAG: YkgJ family cysteine cluster protein, partial [Nitrospinota bacterium]|nr:YkgJ family cysteine cluster protein [Nitrospinota bacterium]